jgi:H+/gluconate symporter-like permease
MKKIFKGLFIVLSFIMILCGYKGVAYASTDSAQKATVSSEQTATKEQAANKQEEPISDGKMILTMFLGMVCMAAVIVIFAAINYKKTKNSERGFKRDIF